LPERERSRAVASPTLERILLITLGLSVALGASEIAARILYEKPWYDQMVEEQLRAPEMDLALNRLRLRDVDYPRVKPAGSLRILILGDSFTFGAWVASAEIFPQLLEVALNSGFEYPGATGIEILNGGTPGSLTKNWVDLYTRVRSDFEPDVILIVFFLRDGTRTTSMGAFFGPIREEIAEKNRASTLYRHVYLSRLYTDYRDRLRVSQDYTQTINRSYVGTADETVEWQNAKRNILKIVRTARDSSAEVGLVIFPVLFGMDEAYPFAAACDEIAAFARQNDIPVHNLLEAFSGHAGPELWVSAYDQHPNATGHAIAAKSMLPFVDRLIRAKMARPDSAWGQPGS
jgi:lysophospholipase L1-like esterase